MTFSLQCYPGIAAILVLSLGLATGCKRSTEFPSLGDPEALRSFLVQESRAFEPIEGRCSGCAVPVPRMRGADDKALRRLARAIHRDAERARTPEALSNLALLRLLVGKADQAVPLLERVVRKTPDQGPLWNDLAAAYLERARVREQPFDYALALAAADEAIRRGTPLAEARFNRAVALERLFLNGQAEAAWKSYLEIEQRSEWARVGRSGLQRLLNRSPEATQWKKDLPFLQSLARKGDSEGLKRLVRRFPQKVREQAEGVFLPAWADASLAGRGEEARQILTVAGRMGRALAESTGEAIVQDAVAAISRANGPQSAVLAQGHRSYREGLACLRVGDLGSAAKLLEHAQESFQAGGSPFRCWADLQAAVCLLQTTSYEEALRKLRVLREDPSHRQYPSLLGRTWSLEGLIQGIGGDPARSLRAYREARALFEAAGEAQNLASTDILIAEAYRLLGDQRSAWKFRYDALSRLDALEDPRRRQRILEETGMALHADGNPAAALYFHNASVAAALKTGYPAGLAEALHRRAVVLQKLGDLPRMSNNLQAAMRQAARVDSEGLRQGLLGEVLTTEAETLRATDPARALALLDEGIGKFLSTGYEQALPGLYLQRARVYRSLKGNPEAQDDLARAIDLLDRQREGIEDFTLQVAHADLTDQAFTELVSLQIAAGRPVEALASAERGRARSSLYGAAMEPIEKVRESLPADLAVVEFLRLDDHFVAWIVERQGVRFVRLPGTRGGLVAQIGRLRDVFRSQGRPEEQRSAAESLHEVLIRPLELKPGRIGTILFVPDEQLYEVPFSALRDRAFGRYLIEDFTLGVVPSLAAVPGMLHRSREKIAFTDALIIGNPAFNRDLLPGLDDLPFSSEEAKRIAEIYERPAVLLGKAATREAVLTKLDQSAVLHFAGHAVAARDVPLFSFLTFAPSASDDPGLLYAYEIARTRLRNTSVVFLSACETGGGYISESGGSMSLGEAFLAAGAPLVVASLWDVEDRATEEFAVEFHRNLVETGDGLAALRKTQSAFASHLMPALREPATWASFQAIGGFSASQDSYGD